MTMKWPLFGTLALSVAVFSGCKFPSTGTVYDRRQAGQSMTVEAGDIVGLRDVQISGRTTVIGVGGGALVGGAAVSGGSGVGGAVAQAAGAVGGAILGEAVEEVATRKRAQEITIKMSKGNMVAVVQEVGKDGEFRVGEHVQVLNAGAGTTVRRLY
jgi:outer membrane lipoprotein SlyB